MQTTLRNAATMCTPPVSVAHCTRALSLVTFLKSKTEQGLGYSDMSLLKRSCTTCETWAQPCPASQHTACSLHRLKSACASTPQLQAFATKFVAQTGGPQAQVPARQTGRRSAPQTAWKHIRGSRDTHPLHHPQGHLSSRTPSPSRKRTAICMSRAAFNRHSPLQTSLAPPPPAQQAAPAARNRQLVPNPCTGPSHALRAAHA